MIEKIRTFFPEKKLTNVELCALFPEWTPEKIFQKTGIASRFIAGPEQTAGDLAFAAAEELFKETDRSKVDFLIFCTQTPDYFLPPTACLLQHRLKLGKNTGAFDMNLGCSGYIYALGLAQSLLQSGMASGVLLLNGDTYTKLLAPEDKSTRAIFGDAAAATFCSASNPNRPHSFVFGTDGSGSAQLIMKSGAMRALCAPSKTESLHMNGPEVFNFTIQAVPPLIRQILVKAQLSMEQIDFFVFHQANTFMLEHLRKKIGIPPEKFILCVEDYGNTVSATIPIALEQMQRQNKIRPGQKLLLAGFGVGLSWAGCVLEVNQPLW
jgi:3-oxoacyl-[acyl-carrier-protein] synthase-3